MRHHAAMWVRVEGMFADRREGIEQLPPTTPCYMVIGVYFPGLSGSIKST